MRHSALVLILSLLTGGAWAQSPSQTEFFESKIRPVLIAKCGSCHGEKVQMAGFRLTDAEALHRSGVVVPGDAEASRMVQALRYGGEIKMPPTGKLPDAEIRAFERWVNGGAVWPETAAGVDNPEAPGHWVLQPVQSAVPPPVKNESWPQTAIDRFVLSKLEDAGPLAFRGCRRVHTAAARNIRSDRALTNA